MNGPDVLIEKYVYELGIVELIISTNSELTECANFKRSYNEGYEEDEASCN